MLMRGSTRFGSRSATESRRQSAGRAAALRCSQARSVCCSATTLRRWPEQQQQQRRWRRAGWLGGGGGGGNDAEEDEAEEEDEGAEMVLIDVGSRGGVGGVSDEAFGPLAVLVIGFLAHELDAFRAMMLGMDADMVKVRGVGGL